MDKIERNSYIRDISVEIPSTYDISLQFHHVNRVIGYQVTSIVHEFSVKVNVLLIRKYLNRTYKPKKKQTEKRNKTWAKIKK